jgi:nicotinamidase-related amidase
MISIRIFESVPRMETRYLQSDNFTKHKIKGNKNMKALLIIDMQKTSFTPRTPRYNSEEVIGRINQLSELFRKNGESVIVIQHDGTKEGFCIPGTEEWELVPSLVAESGDLKISKTANDSFYRTSLRNDLVRLGVDELVITGCATDFCVDSTVKSALVNDFKVTVISDAHTTADRPNLKAKQVIDQYNWVWNEMTPTKGSINVIGFEEYVKSRVNCFTE